MSRATSRSRKAQKQVNVQQLAVERAQRTPAQQLELNRKRNAALKAQGRMNSHEAKRETARLQSLL